MIGEHQLNRESSRSHSLFMLNIEMRPRAEGGEVVVAKLNLVDLAGSERVSRTKSEGLVLKEAGHINKSLSMLEQGGGGGGGGCWSRWGEGGTVSTCPPAPLPLPCPRLSLLWVRRTVSTCPPAPALPQVVLALGEAHREHVPPCPCPAPGCPCSG